MKEELAKLQGAWSIDALEVDGATMQESSVRGSQIVVKGSAFDTISMGATYKGKLKIDPAKTPKTLDLIFEAGPEKGNRSLAIYELDGDTWRICLTVTAKTRPKAFATTPGSGLALETLKRGAAEPDPLRAEPRRIEPAENHRLHPDGRPQPGRNAARHLRAGGRHRSIPFRRARPTPAGRFHGGGQHRGNNDGVETYLSMASRERQRPDNFIKGSFRDYRRAHDVLLLGA
jgi:uncharacterized protein (TIGR03067 family)